MNAESIRALRAQGKHEEARRLAVELAAGRPGDAEVHYEAACVHDFLGYETEAIPFYEAAIAGGLGPIRLRSAFVGLGSTFRALGRYAEARATLLDGLARFPEANEIKVFLAMTRHNLGQSKEAVESLLMLLAATTSDESVQRYRNALELYARDIERAWPPGRS